MTTQITTNNITNNSIGASALASGIVSPKITSVAITDSSYNVLDDTAANTTGGYIQISGSNFTSTSQVVIGTNNATSVTYVNSAIIRAQVPAAAATSYPVYVIDTTTGATAIKINGLTQSSFPAWGTAATLANTIANTVFSVSLSANSDSNITYSNTSALPAGTSLLSNGYFYGTVTIGQQTTYSFDVKATDAELQDATRTFSLTVTIVPQTKLWVWGFASNGQLGQNNTVDRSSPVQVGTGTNWNEISGGRFATIATKTDGTLWTWGRNSYGQLGLNITTSDYKSSPTQVGTNTTWNLISLSSYHALATKIDGTLWAWGKNNFGQLGQNNIVYKSSPVQIGVATTWNKISNGMVETSAAISTNGSLWVWGRNNYGTLGLNDTVFRSSPVQVGTDTNWSDVSVGYFSMAALKTNGTLWLWGHGNYGTLGQNATGHRSSPVQVGVGTNWSKVNNGAFTVFAIKTDGTLWAWGPNFGGQIGLNSSVTTYISSPTQVGVLTNWSLVKNNSYATIGLKTDGTLWSWGRNGNGRLGLNDAVYRSSPVQIGSGTTWSKIAAAGEFNVAITSN